MVENFGSLGNLRWQLLKQVTTRHKRALVVACVHWVFYHINFSRISSCPWNDRGAGHCLQPYLAAGVCQELAGVVQCFSSSLLVPTSLNLLQTPMKFSVISKCTYIKKKIPEHCKRRSWAAAAAAFHANTISYLMAMGIPCTRWCVTRRKWFSSVLLDQC